MLKIIIIGPESSGKTSLANNLSKYYKIDYTKEYAREYLNNLDRKYNKEDLLKIAKIQFKKEHENSKNNSLSLHDTDLVTIKIWSNFKYNDCQKWIIDKIQEQKKENRFYLICKPDIPWTYDPLRENPNNREELFEVYKKEISNLNHPFIIISGQERLDQAKRKIESLIEKLQ